MKNVATLTRSQLLSLLSEACELEHGLACSYLYSAFSLKQELSEGDMTWEQLQLVRKWAAQLYFVASEEMLHLAQAWNILASIGGTPYYLRPNFPQNSKYYPLKLPLLLESFGVSAIRRFIYYERPRELAHDRNLIAKVGVDQIEYSTVGDLYATIRDGIASFPEKQLFIGTPQHQVGPELVDFPDLIKVVDRPSALAAIDMITEQGEGSRTNTTDCHYGVFLKIEQEFAQEVAQSISAGRRFEPVRQTVLNPIARERGGTAGGTLVTSLYAREVMETFDEIYGLMLRLLQFVFDNATSPSESVRKMARSSILLMVRVIKPLGEALTQISATGDSMGLRAGPSFGLTRHVPLPRDDESARIMVRESIKEIITKLQTATQNNAASAGISTALKNLQSMDS